jgi:hypothetical protein
MVLFLRNTNNAYIQKFLAQAAQSRRTRISRISALVVPLYAD